MLSLTDKLNKLLEEKNITKSQLSKESGIPYTTIAGFYTKGTDNVKLSTLRKLAEYFDCSLDYLVDDKIEASKDENNIENRDIEKIIDEIMEQKGLMLCGEPMSEEDMFLLRNSIRSTIELAKTMKGNKK